MRINVALFSGNVPIMGEAARGWLSQGQRGKVLAAVTHAIYLLAEDGELVWLATAESPKHRRCIQSAALPRLAVDSTFTIQGQSINFKSGKKLDFRDLRIWETPALPVSEVIEFEILPYKLFAVVESFLARETPVGYGTFIQPVLQIAKNRDSSNGFQPENILTTAAWPIIERIARACLAHDLPAVLQQAESLIGLGEGLTPSGDDFTGGLLFCIYWLQRLYPTHLPFNNPSRFIESLCNKTNLISFTMLKDLADGHGVDTLHQFVNAFLIGQPMDDLRQIASELIHIGHSTGWDLLAGVLTGMLLTCRIGESVTIHLFAQEYTG